jgi:hypothetical protein
MAASDYGQKAIKGASVGTSVYPGLGTAIGAANGLIQQGLIDADAPDWLKTLNDPFGLFDDAPEYDPEEDWKNQARAIEMTQYAMNNPYGSVNWTGSIYDGTRAINSQFSPSEQKKYDSVIGMLGELNSSYGDDAAKRAEEAVYDTFLRRNTPVFERDLTDLQTRLVNQGIPIGSEAYNRAIQDIYNSQYDANLNAANQSVLTGQQTKQSELGGLIDIYNAINNSIVDPLTGYSAASGGGSITPNYMNQYQQELADYNSNQQMISGLASSLGSAISKMQTSNANNAFSNYNPSSNLNYAQNNNYLGSYLNNNSSINPAYMYSSGAQNPNLSSFYSDARIKENIEPVGQLDNGLTVYKFNFKGEEVTRIGLIAQEVAELMPEAVSQDEEGLLKVNYDMACQPLRDEPAQQAHNEDAAQVGGTENEDY